MSSIAKIPVDKEKFISIINQRGLSQVELGDKIGYLGNSISSALKRGSFTKPMWLAISRELEISIDSVTPDPEPEPIPVPEEVEVPAQDVVLDPNDIESRRFSFFNDEELEILNMFQGKVQEVVDLLKQQRKVVSEETLAQGFNWGLELFWGNHKKEIQDLILKNIKGAIFSGNLEALKKHDELLDERSPYREFIMPVENGRPER